MIDRDFFDFVLFLRVFFNARAKRPRKAFR